MSGMLSYSEVAKHNKEDDLWTIVDNKVYDLSGFEHPGGKDVLMANAGQDATEDFETVHSLGMLKDSVKMTGTVFKGNVDPATVPKKEAKKPVETPELDEDEIPPLRAMLNLHDIEAVAQRQLLKSGKKQAWDYYSSGAADELTYNENVSAFQRMWLRPRILVDVKEVSLETSLLGSKADFPVYLTAVAMCGMGHKDGECAWMRAASEADIPFMVPNLSSKTFDEIMESKNPNQDAWYQMYVHPDKAVVKRELEKLEAADVKVLCITVDSAVPGKRERDLRNKIAQDLGKQQGQEAAAKGTKSRKAGNYANRDPGLSWQDLEWFQANTTMKIVLKGVQTSEDAILAAEKGVHGIILSNHGGRNLDTSRSGIEVLPEVMDALREKGLDSKIEVFVDGGVRRGTDILKALALGAKGVGLGKPAVYAMSAYGAEGVARMLEILREELVKAMQLCGAASLADLRREMVDARSIGDHSHMAPPAPSPYAPRAVDAPRAEIRELRAEIARLAELVEKNHQAAGAKSGAAAFASALVGGLLTLPFHKEPHVLLHRTAVLLFAYVIAHAAGAAAAFLGEDTFNAFHAALAASSVFFVVQLYVGIAALAHAGVAMKNTSRKVKSILENPLKFGALSLSGSVMAYFAYIHYTLFWAKAVPEQGYYAMQRQAFSDPAAVATHVAGMGALVWHLQVGWPKTVMKMKFNEEEKKAITSFGVWLAYPVFVLLVAAPVFFFLTSAGYKTQ